MKRIRSQANAKTDPKGNDFSLLNASEKINRFPNQRSASQQHRTMLTKRNHQISKAVSWSIRMLAGLLLVLLIVGVTGTAVFMGWVHSVIKDTPPLSAKNIYQHMEKSTLVYDGQDEYLITVESPVHRRIVPYQQIPEVVRNAFIAIEDERYWQHPGIDTRRIFGVIWLNFREGTRQGASTLNQQLVKNLFLTREQTYERKIQDIYYGIELQQQLTKEQILEAYLNQIYLGRGAYGVQAAAEVYFGKNASELTLAEASYLATIPRNPTRYALTVVKAASELDNDETLIRMLDNDRALIPNKEAKRRQNLVLSAMLRNQLITEEEYQIARDTPLESLLRTTDLFGYENTWYFMDMVQKEAVEAISAHYAISRQEAMQQLIHGGFKIYTTLRPDLQRIVETYYSEDDHFPGYNPGINQPQSAFVLSDHRTGEVLAVIGGRHIDEGRQLFNRAAEPRQPGSAMKAIAAFFPALEHGYSPDVYIDDKPVQYDLEDPTRNWPRNWYEGYRGRMSLEKALAQSSNVAGVHLLGQLTENHETNLAIMGNSLSRLGITTYIPRTAPLQRGTELTHDEVYSTVLGGMTYGVSPLEMTMAFGTFANEGIRMQPTVIRRIESASGEVIYRGKQSNQVTSTGVAYLMTDMLVEAVTEGTGKRAAITPNNRDIPVAGKTGTTTSMRDAWFVGYTPYYSAAVWVGNDQNEDLVQGSAMAAKIWSDLMKQIHEGFEPRHFVEPPDIVRVTVNPNDNKLASHGSPRVTARYAQGQEPTAYTTYRPPPPPPEPEPEENTEVDSLPVEDTEETVVGPVPVEGTEVDPEIVEDTEVGPASD